MEAISVGDLVEISGGIAHSLGGTKGHVMIIYLGAHDITYTDQSGITMVGYRQAFMAPDGNLIEFSTMPHCRVRSRIED